MYLIFSRFSSSHASYDLTFLRFSHSHILTFSNWLYFNIFEVSATVLRSFCNFICPPLILSMGLVMFASIIQDMKTILSFILLFQFITIGFAQKKDIDVFERKEGNNVLVIARNTGTIDYSVTVKITSKGMNVLPADTVEAAIPAGFMKQMATITPRPGESWEYGYQVSYLPLGNKAFPPVAPTTPDPTAVQTTAAVALPVSSTAPELSKANIILYSKPGCGRCDLVKRELTSSGIAFEEYSTTSDSPEISNMWAGLRSSGFTGGSVTMPVVRAEGQYHYNIPDLNGFIASLKK